MAGTKSSQLCPAAGTPHQVGAGCKVDAPIRGMSQHVLREVTKELLLNNTSLGQNRALNVLVWPFAFRDRVLQRTSHLPGV